MTSSARLTREELADLVGDPVERVQELTARGVLDMGKRADQKAAYKQLLDYHEDLEIPPLLIVGDIERTGVPRIQVRPGDNLTA